MLDKEAVLHKGVTFTFSTLSPEEKSGVAPFLRRVSGECICDAEEESVDVEEPRLDGESDRECSEATFEDEDECTKGEKVCGLFRYDASRRVDENRDGGVNSPGRTPLAFGGESGFSGVK